MASRPLERMLKLHPTSPLGFLLLTLFLAAGVHGFTIQSDCSACHAMATCIADTCACANGYVGDGFVCADMNECLTNSPCNLLSECTDLVGEFACGPCNGGTTTDDNDVEILGSGHGDDCRAALEFPRSDLITSCPPPYVDGASDFPICHGIGPFTAPVAIPLELGQCPEGMTFDREITGDQKFTEPVGRCIGVFNTTHTVCVVDRTGAVICDGTVDARPAEAFYEGPTCEDDVCPQNHECLTQSVAGGRLPYVCVGPDPPRELQTLYSFHSESNGAFIPPEVVVERISNMHGVAFDNGLSLEATILGPLADAANSIFFAFDAIPGQSGTVLLVTGGDQWSLHVVDGLELQLRQADQTVASLLLPSPRFVGSILISTPVVLRAWDFESGAQRDSAALHGANFDRNDKQLSFSYTSSSTNSERFVERLDVLATFGTRLNLLDEMKAVCNGSTEFTFCAEDSVQDSCKCEAEEPWPETPCNTRPTLSDQCPPGSEGIVERFCTPEGVFLDEDFSFCVRNNLKNLGQQVVNLQEEDIDSLSTSMSTEINGENDLSAGDVSTSLNLLHKVVSFKRNNKLPQSTKNSWLDTIGNLLKEDKEDLEKSVNFTDEGGFISAEYRVEQVSNETFPQAAFLDTITSFTSAETVRIVELAQDGAVVTVLVEATVDGSVAADGLDALLSASRNQELLRSFNSRLTSELARSVLVLSQPKFYTLGLTIVLEAVLTSIASDLEAGQTFTFAGDELESVARLADCSADTVFTVGSARVVIPPAAIDTCSSSDTVIGSELREKSTFASDAALLEAPTTNEAFTILDSEVMTVALPGKDTSSLDAPIRFELTKTGPAAAGTTSRCTYWDEQRLTWDTEGCTLVETSGSTVTCECTHLTYFAILTTHSGASPSGAHRYAQQLITYIGLGISIPCLFVTFLTYLIFKSLRSKAKFIIMNLALSLGLAQSAFLFGIARTSNQDVCEAFGMVLHYTLLCAFAWMLLDGIFLYRTFCCIFEAMSDNSRYKTWLFVGYVLPAVPVAITALIDRHRYQRGDEACWLSDSDGYIWAFLGPASAVLFVNCIFFALILNKIQKLPVSGRSGFEKARVKTRRAFKASLSFLPLMGLSWVFGLLVIGESAIYFQYIFTVSSVLQGVVLFVFHVVLEEGLRTLLKQRKRRQASRAQLYEKDSLAIFAGTRIKLNPSVGSKVSTSDPLPPTQAGTPMVPIFMREQSGGSNHFYPESNWSEESYSGFGSLYPDSQQEHSTSSSSRHGRHAKSPSMHSKANSLASGVTIVTTLSASSSSRNFRN